MAGLFLDTRMALSAFQDGKQQYSWATFFGEHEVISGVFAPNQTFAKPAKAPGSRTGRGG